MVTWLREAAKNKVLSLVARPLRHYPASLLAILYAGIFLVFYFIASIKFSLFLTMQTLFKHIKDTFRLYVQQ